MSNNKEQPGVSTYNEDEHKTMQEALDLAELRAAATWPRRVVEASVTLPRGADIYTKPDVEEENVAIMHTNMHITDW